MSAHRPKSKSNPPRPSPPPAVAPAGPPKRVAYDPERLLSFVAGEITLGDLEGISKAEQVKMAKIGHELLQQGKLDRAEKIFLGLLALDPFDAYFHMAYASIAHRRGELEVAEARYSRSLEINPFSAIALAHRGEVRLALGRVEAAIGDLVGAVREDAAGHEPSTHRARALLETVAQTLQQAVAPTRPG